MNTEYMNFIILSFVIYEVVLFIKIRSQCSSQERQLCDLYHNITKNLSDAPDRLTGQSTFDRASMLLAYMERKISSNARDLTALRRNIGIQIEKNSINNTFLLEKNFSVASGLVHIFPLLGILGTLVALYGLSGKEEGLTGTGIESAFITAIMTTIIGIVSAAVFMFWESKVSIRVAKVVASTEKANQLFAKAAA